MNRPMLLPLLLVLASASSQAHDTWFEHRQDLDGDIRLALGTGSTFPLFETGIDSRYLVQRGCRAGRVAAALTPAGNAPDSLRLRGPVGATTCWVQLAPFEVVLAADKIERYLREVGASPALRATWSAMAARGLPWRERYTKHARIELGPPDDQPAPLGMDLLIEHDGAIQAGQPLTVRVLRDGQPLAGQAVELRGAVLPLGIWRRSDRDGRFQVPVPTPGRWLLRAIDLRVSAASADVWDSRFVTLAFEVQNGITLKSSARSASQTEASPAITSEPPVSTMRR